MIDIKDRICDAVAGKVMEPTKAAEFVNDGDNVGFSGFTPSGYPKAVPLALAERGKNLLLKSMYGLALPLAPKSTKLWLKPALLTAVFLIRPMLPCAKQSTLAR